MESGAIETFLEHVTAWSRGLPAIEAVALLGSHARGQASAGSDVDLLILISEPRQLLADPAWPGIFGPVDRVATEAWGDVVSRRVWYRTGLEVEFGIATPAWAERPLDADKRAVIAAGFRVLLDRTGALAQLRPVRPPGAGA